ncbi:MAG: F0F1 ATP synthase subunit gamma [Patescibacteria group bacterium]|nr:F0F1 ATP synthase subunit gamma [Patescibacteria group bacterium]
MPTYLDFHDDVTALEDVTEAVKAMEMSAASHVQRERRVTTSMQEYVDVVVGLTAAFARRYRLADHPVFMPKSDGVDLLFIVGGERGLVGGLYTELVRRYEREEKKYGRIVAVGRRSAQWLVDEGIKPDEVMAASEGSPDRQQSAALAKYALDGFLNGDLRSVDFLFPKFVSLSVQQPEIRAFLPFVLPHEIDPGTAADLPGWPVLAPGRSAVADGLLRRYLDYVVFGVLAEANLSEFAARTVAMEEAGAQAEREIKRLRLRYFKERRRFMSQKQAESFFALRTV